MSQTVVRDMIYSRTRRGVLYFIQVERLFPGLGTVCVHKRMNRAAPLDLTEGEETKTTLKLLMAASCPELLHCSNIVPSGQTRPYQAPVN